MTGWNDIKSEILTSKQKSILLGNGFTIACIGKENFNQKKIINNVHKFFKNRNNIKNITNIEDYIYKIETKFIETLYELLPDNKISNLTNGNTVFSEFLKNFENYFTLNYDPILYYLSIRLNKLPNKNFSNDGFRSSKKGFYWYESKMQNLFYLHGAFHLIKNVDGKIKKIVRDNFNNISLLDKIKNEWSKGAKPHIIISSDYISKNLKLTNKDYSQYLKYCFDKFCNIKGILVTVGVSFSKSDTHILEAIINNQKLSKIYIGYYNDYEKENLEKLFSSCKKVKFFSTKNMFDT